MISIIVAVSENNVIGKDNQLIWHLPADLKNFKQITMGHPILMGRRTYESIGRPLPGRTNIIITRQPNYKADNCLIFNSLTEAFKEASKLDDNIFIIGGQDIYQQALPFATTIYMTVVHKEFSGDSFFPVLDPQKWEEVSRSRHSADDKNKFDYSFVKFQRIK